MYPKLKINVYFIFLNLGDLTFGITLVSHQKKMALRAKRKAVSKGSYWGKC
jgi:hypothetical protein